MFKGAAAFNHANDFDAAYWDRVFHQGSHPYYSDLIEKRIKLLKMEFTEAVKNAPNGKPTDEILKHYYKEIEKILDKADEALKNNPNVPINEVKINF
jgi:hypothetical protein